MAQLVALRGTGESWLIGFPDAFEEVSIFHLLKSHYGSLAAFLGALLVLAAGSTAPLDLPIFTSFYPP
jgi:hypothetical protein